MRLPKTVTINSKVFNVVRKPKNVNSHFSYSKRKITVGGKYAKEALEGFLHEVAEIACVERGMRYRNDKPICGLGFCNSEVLFCGNHQQFEEVISDITETIKPMIEGI